MKKFFQKMVFNAYVKKIEKLRQASNPNRFIHAMNKGVLRQDILTDVFVGRLTMTQGRELMKRWEEA